METLFNIGYWFFIALAALLGFVLMPKYINRHKKATDLKERRMLEHIILLTAILIILIIGLIFIMQIYR